jgi:hypothetical protein
MHWEDHVEGVWYGEESGSFFNIAFCVCDNVVSVTYTQYLMGQHMAYVIFVINSVWITQIAMSFHVLVF